jgi:ArsR family metal-binding transcriptional regulator
MEWKEERLTGIASETKGTTRVRPLFALRYLKLNYCKNVEGEEICTKFIMYLFIAKINSLL